VVQRKSGQSKEGFTLMELIAGSNKSEEDSEGLFNEHFILAVEAAPNAMIMINSDGYIVLSNSLTETLFGYSRAELTNKSVELLVPQKHRHGHLTYRATFFSHPVVRPMGAGRDLFGRHKDGTEIPVEIGLNPLSTPSGTFVLASIIDIRERKIAEEKLKDSLQEKEILLKEIHHRVKNNLQVVASLLDIQASYCKDPEVLEMFRESRDRVHAIGIIHERLYLSKNLDRIDLGEYLQALASDLFDSYGTNREFVRLEVIAMPVPANIDTANSCGLIVHELVSNALKHAFQKNAPGAITIEVQTRIEEETPLIVVIVRDNGKGFPTNIDFRATESLGLQLVITLVEQLQGSIELDVKSGTAFTLSFHELQYKERIPSSAKEVAREGRQP
jgi:two-component system, sensor histidine kinase PdtaS